MPRKKLSPQVRWARKMIKRGRCRICGEKRQHFAQLCDKHQGQINAYMKVWRQKRKPIVTVTTPQEPLNAPTL